MPIMMLRIVAIVLTALLLGTTFGHALEMPAKLRATGPQWLEFQHTLYASFATIGGLVEIGAIVAAAWLTYVERAEGVTFALTGAAALLLTLAFVVIWLGFTNPVNARTAVWTSETMPADWTRWRDQWEYSHLARFTLHLAAFLALIVALARAAAR